MEELNEITDKWNSHVKQITHAKSQTQNGVSLYYPSNENIRFVAVGILLFTRSVSHNVSQHNDYKLQVASCQLLRVLVYFLIFAILLYNNS